MIVLIENNRVQLDISKPKSRGEIIFFLRELKEVEDRLKTSLKQFKDIKRIYHNHKLWEDCNNGILKNNFNEKETEELTKKAKELLCNPKLFSEVGMDVIINWKYSSEQHLSNINRNRQAWIGQASCCYKFGVPEYITKYAWRLMTIEQQKEANAIADEIIKRWEEKYAEKIFEQKCL